MSTRYHHHANDCNVYRLSKFYFYPMGLPDKQANPTWVKCQSKQLDISSKDYGKLIMFNEYAYMKALNNRTLCPIFCHTFNARTLLFAFQQISISELFLLFSKFIKNVYFINFLSF